MKILYVSLYIILLCSSCRSVYDFKNNEISKNNSKISLRKINDIFNLDARIIIDDYSTIKNFEYISGWIQIGNKKILFNKAEMKIIIWAIIKEGDPRFVLSERCGQISISNFDYYIVENIHEIVFTVYLNDNDMKEINKEIINDKKYVNIYFEFIINDTNYIINIHNGFILRKGRESFSNFILGFMR